MRNNINIETISIGMGGESTFRRLRDPLNKRSMRESQLEIREVSVDNYKKFERDYNKKEHHIDDTSIKAIKDIHGYTPLNNTDDDDNKTVKNVEVRTAFAEKEKIDAASKAIEKRYNIPSLFTRKLLESKK